MTRLILASHNPKKAAELHSILTGLPFETLFLKDFPGAPVPVEDGETFAENAVKKACAIAAWSGELSLADDSGLCVDALGGAPGVRSARYAGNNQDDAGNCAKLLAEMREVPADKRGAAFHCVIALADGRGLVGTAEGECGGYIATERRGGGGFGYDPVFVYPMTGQHFAELAPEEKNRVSHRGLALGKVRHLLAEYAAGRLIARSKCI